MHVVEIRLRIAVLSGYEIALVSNQGTQVNQRTIC